MTEEITTTKEIATWNELADFLGEDRFGMPIGHHGGYETDHPDRLLSEEEKMAGDFKDATFECWSTQGEYGPHETIRVLYTGPVNERYLDD